MHEADAASRGAVARQQPARVRVVGHGRAFRNPPAGISHLLEAAKRKSSLFSWEPNLAASMWPGMQGAAPDTEELQLPYLQAAWVAACVDLFAMAKTMARPRIWDRDPDLDGAQEITEGPFYKLFAESPMEGLTAEDARVTDAQNVCLFNESIHFLRGKDGGPVGTVGAGPYSLVDIPHEITPVKGTMVGLEVNERTGMPEFWRVRTPHGEALWPAGAVVVHGEIPDPYRQHRYISRAAKAWGPAAAGFFADRYQEFLLRNAGDPAGIVSIDGTMAPDEVARFKSELREEWGDPERAGDWRLMWGGAKVEHTKNTPRDLEWPSVHSLSQEKICAVFGTPGALLGKKDENFATFHGHWQMFTQMRVSPALIIEAGQWNALFRRCRDKDVRNWHVRYDLEIFDHLFADLKDQSENARKFFGVGVPLNEALRQVGVKTDPIPGGDVPMLDQGILPFASAIIIGRANAAARLIELGVPREAALKEADLGHLPVGEPPPPPGKPAPAPAATADEIPKPSNAGDHDDEVADRAARTAKELSGAPEAMEQATLTDEDLRAEWKVVHGIQAKARKRLEGSIKRVLDQMRVCQLVAIERVAAGLPVDRAAIFAERKTLAKYADGESPRPLPHIYTRYSLSDPEIARAMLDLDMAEERQMFEDGDERVVRAVGCRATRKYIPWRPRLRELAAADVSVQHLEDMTNLAGARLDERTLDSTVLVVSDHKWRDVLCERIRRDAQVAADDASESMSPGAAPRDYGWFAADEAASIQRVVVARVRADICRVLGGKSLGPSAGSWSKAVAVRLPSIKEAVSKAFKSIAGRVTVYARRQIARAVSEARYANLKALASSGTVAAGTWVCMPDCHEDSSHGHLHGTTQPIGSPYTTSSGVEMTHPHQHDAPADEVMECMCILVGSPTIKKARP